MRATRFVWFVIMIAAGVASGLYYTWVKNPVHFVNATFYQLKSDYKADYVLMCAEVYGKEQVLYQTMVRLDALLENSAEEAVANAISTAGKLGYSETDVDLLYALNDAIGGKVAPLNPEPEDIFIDLANPDAMADPTSTDEVSQKEENPFLQPNVTPDGDNPFSPSIRGGSSLLDANHIPVKSEESTPSQLTPGNDVWGVP